MIVIGLDVSTSITGIAVLEDGKLIHSVSVNTKNKKHFPEPTDVAFQIRRELINLKIKPDKIIIEESLFGFAGGKTTAKTLIKLAQINGLVRFICEDLYGKKPEKISARKARKKVGITIPAKTDRKEVKKIVLREVDSLLENFSYENTIHGNPREEAYDRADAAVIALSHDIDE